VGYLPDIEQLVTHGQLKAQLQFDLQLLQDGRCVEDGVQRGHVLFCHWLAAVQAAASQASTALQAHKEFFPQDSAEDWSLAGQRSLQLLQQCEAEFSDVWGLHVGSGELLHVGDGGLVPAEL